METFDSVTIDVDLDKLLNESDEYLILHEKEIIAQLGGLRKILVHLSTRINSNTTTATATATDNHLDAGSESNALKQSSIDSDSGHGVIHPAEKNFKNGANNTTNETSQPIAKKKHILDGSDHDDHELPQEMQLQRNRQMSTVEQGESTIIAYPMNDIWHLIFEKCNNNNNNNNDIADRISTFLNSSTMIKYIIPSILLFIAFFQLSFIISQLLSIDNQVQGSGLNIFYIMYCLILFILLLTLMFSFDHVIFFQQLKSFDTLYKLYNAILMEIGWTLRIIDADASVQIFEVLSLITIVLFISTYDAWNINRKIKILFVCSMITTFAGWYVASFSLNSDHFIKIFGVEVSFKSINLGALVNLLIFLVKQVVFMIKDPHLASGITQRPQIIWK